MTHAQNIAVTLGWLAGSYKIANAISVKIAAAVGTDIRDSAISGKGLFATRSFTTGDVLVTDFMQKQNTDDPRTRWEQSDSCRYTNHSDKPNAFIRKLGETVELVADETIQPNEEITCNYRDASKTLGKAFFYTYRGKPYGNATSEVSFMQKAAATKPDTFYGLPTFLKQSQTTDDILDRIANARAQTATEVSDGNATAGNYRKGRFNYHGLRISIENPKGSTRSGTAADGTRWSTKMKFDYGYIRGTTGADGDPVDVFIGDDPKSELVFIVNQVNKSGSFDEHKVVLGAMDAKQAKQTYLSNYKDGWTGCGSVIGMTMQQFKDWLQGDVMKPAESIKQAAIGTLQPWQTALGGAVLGGGAGGLADYLTGADSVWDGVIGGAVTGGLVGHAGNPVINAVGHAIGAIENKVNTPGGVSLSSVLPKNYEEKARQHAEAYRKTEPRIPFKQRIDPDSLSRKVKVTNNVEKHMVGNSAAAASYNPLTDTMNVPRGRTDALPHELTHAAQSFAATKPESGIEDLSLSSATDRAIRDPSMSQYLGGQRGGRHETEAYLADIKRKYFTATGKHVKTPEDAAKAIQWRINEVGKTGGRVPLLDSKLFNLSNGTDTERNDVSAWIDQLIRIMPGLVQKDKPAAGVKQAVAALPQVQPQPLAIKPKRKKKQRSFPLLGATLGAGAATAYGLHRAIASDTQAQNLNNTLRDYDPTRFQTGNYPPNQTGWTYYENTMVPAAQLSPFGVPVSKIMPAIRSSPKLMGKEPIVDISAIRNKSFLGVPYGKGIAKVLESNPAVKTFLEKGLDTPSYHMATPEELAGISGTAHYDGFAKGVIPAYMHQMKAKGRGISVPAELGGSAGTTYADWMGKKIEDFIQSKPGNVNPFEVTPQLFSNEKQKQLMEEFHAGLSPAEQAFRLKVEDPGEQYAKQVANYMGPAKGLMSLRDKLKTVGITGGGAALGAMGGHYLYNKLKGDKKRDPLMRALASTAGAGLGSGASYLLGTEAGRNILNRLLNGGNKSAETIKQAGSPFAALGKVLKRTAATASRVPVPKVVRNAVLPTVKPNPALVAANVAAKPVPAVAARPTVAARTVARPQPVAGRMQAPVRNTPVAPKPVPHPTVAAVTGKLRGVRDTVANVPKGEAFSQRPIANTGRLAMLDGVPGMRLVNRAALGAAGYTAGSHLLDANNAVNGAIDTSATQLGDYFDATPEQRAGFSGDLYNAKWNVLQDQTLGAAGRGVKSLLGGKRDDRVASQDAAMRAAAMEAVRRSVHAPEDGAAKPSLLQRVLSKRSPLAAAADSAPTLMQQLVDKPSTLTAAGRVVDNIRRSGVDVNNPTAVEQALRDNFGDMYSRLTPQQLNKLRRDIAIGTAVGAAALR